MSIIRQLVEEVKTTPVNSFISPALSGCALLVAIIQAKTQATMPMVQQEITVTGAPNNLALLNLVIIIVFFFSTTFSISAAVSKIAKQNAVLAIFVSVIAAIVSSLFTLILVKVIPPKPLTPEFLKSTKDLVYWGTLCSFGALNGLAVLRSCYPTPNSKPEIEKTEGEEDEIEEDTSSPIYSMIWSLGIFVYLWQVTYLGGLNRVFDLFIK